MNKTEKPSISTLAKVTSEKAYLEEAHSILQISADPIETIDRMIKNLWRCKRIPTGKVRKRLNRTREGFHELKRHSPTEGEKGKYLEAAIISGRTNAHRDIRIERERPVVGAIPGYFGT